MEFNSDLSQIDVPNTIKSTECTKFPSFQEVCYHTKRKEIFELYGNARWFLAETSSDNWAIAFPNMSEANTTRAMARYNSMYYEAALNFYNCIVDLSWMLCYAAVEYAFQKKGTKKVGNMVMIEQFMPIENAYDLLRRMEKESKEPTSEESPLIYLKRVVPEFTGIIDKVIKFWIDFKDNSIRINNNYCKHRGKPQYTELVEKLGKITLRIGDKTIPSSARDMRLELNLNDEINKLKKFDDEILFPYILELEKEIESILRPSSYLSV